YFRFPHRDQDVADNEYFHTESIEIINPPFEVTRCAARLRAWSRRRAQINNSFGWHSMSAGNRLVAPNFFFKPRQFPPRLRHIARASHRFTTESNRRTDEQIRSRLAHQRAMCVEHQPFAR